MKVYIVQYEGWNDIDTIGVFDNLELAEAAIRDYLVSKFGLENAEKFEVNVILRDYEINKRYN